MSSPRRLIFSVLALALPFLGLAVRHWKSHFPALAAEYLPDALWALLVFCIVRALWPRQKLQTSLAGAVTFSFLIEFSQLYQAPWINAWRANPVGALLLGHGFLWSDLACYLVGISAGGLLDLWLNQRSHRPGPLSHDPNHPPHSHFRERDSGRIHPLFRRGRTERQ